VIGRIVLAAALGLAAALPPSALGFTPRLLVTAGEQPASTVIELGEPDGATAEVSVFAPPAYSARLDPLPGERVGRVPSATVSVAGLPMTLQGELRATDPTGEATPICTAGPHESTMLLALHAPGLDVTMPVELDRAQGTETGYASYRLRICPGDASAPRLLAIRLVLDDLFVAPQAPGRHVWRGVFTPFSVEGIPEPGVAVETRSILPLPVRLTLDAAYDVHRGAVTLGGSLSAGGEPVAGQRVRLFAGPGAWPRRGSGAVRTGAEGRFRAVRGIAAATSFRAATVLPGGDVTATECDDPIAPAGCVAAVIPALRAESAAVRVRAPAPLAYGSRGPLVRTLQRSLARLRYLPPGSAQGTFDDRTWHAVIAFQGWHGLTRDGVVTPQVWRALGKARPPRPWGGMRNGLEIDIARQVLFLVADGRVVRAIHVSTGAGGATPLGRFAVYRKELMSWSVPFQVWMPYASYFYGGFAMHSYPSVPAYPASHGCVRVPPVEAPGVYSFASYGSPVWIR
jgi:peptidoglycan hydrolase-like protein with peptidoglycan-binding domain